MEPELITIVEGPTPAFHQAPELWNLSVFEGPEPISVTSCRLRTLNGRDIQDRCSDAWVEGRPVQLDFPDDLRMRQTLDVVAMRLDSVDEGQVLRLWLRQPLEIVNIDEDDEDDDFEDGVDGLDPF